jgi:hypothetical protein
LIKTARSRIIALMMVGSIAMPLTGGWSGASTNAGAQALNRGPVAQYYATHSLSAAGHGAYTVVPLTADEITSLGLAQMDATTGEVRAQQAAFANAAFQRTWERTDKPVASGQVQRSWYWGPAPISDGLQEDYAEGVGGKRLVQYFDKSRMEINNPNADPNSPFYVTNGLLTVELISGKMQTGNSTYVDRYPADIALASDPDDANAPTYLSFQGVSNTPLGDHPQNSRVGLPATATITRSGQVGDDATKSTYPKVNIAYFDPGTKHNVPQAIWEFLNESGPVVDAAGQTVNARLSDPWFYATGLPISDAYWARVKIAGQMQDVLIQAFERRVVTYVPNGVPGFKVQMGNIGQHYYDWRYKDAGRPQGPIGTPTPQTPAATPTTGGGTNPTPTTPSQPTPPAPDCSGIPDPRDATINPNCGPIGTVFQIRIFGFQPNERISFWLTLPSGEVAGTPEPLDVGNHPGSLNDTFPSEILEGFPDAFGIWAITYQGDSSGHQSIVWFKITPDPNQTPTPGPTTPPNATTCDDIPASQNMTISPSNCGRAGTQFRFLGRGFQPGEDVGVYVTAPDQSVVGAPFQITADGTGAAGTVQLNTQPNFPLGVWAMTMEGTSSHARAIGYFKLTPP